MNEITEIQYLMQLSHENIIKVHQLLIFALNIEFLNKDA